MSVIASAWMAGMIQDVETIPCIAQETVTEVMSKAGSANYKGPGQSFLPKYLNYWVPAEMGARLNCSRGLGSLYLING